MTLCSFINHTAPTEIYTLSLHDALPISLRQAQADGRALSRFSGTCRTVGACPTASRAVHRCSASSGSLRLRAVGRLRSEEHTSELQSHVNLVCRLLLEKKNP